MVDENKIISIIKENIECKDIEIHNESKLVDDLGIDSFNILMIIDSIEEEFNIKVNDDDFKDIITVSDIFNKINSIIIDPV